MLFGFELKLEIIIQELEHELFSTKRHMTTELSKANAAVAEAQMRALQRSMIHDSRHSHAPAKSISNGIRPITPTNSSSTHGGRTQSHGSSSAYMKDETLTISSSLGSLIYN